MVVAAQEAASKNGCAVKKGGRPPTPLETVIEALFYRLRNAGPWRDLPKNFGPWRTIYGWHRRFARQGLWGQLLESMASETPGRVRLVDGTHIPVHQSGANPAGGVADQAMGQTRGGRNTKLMMLADGQGRAVAMKLIEGQAYEGAHVIDLLAHDQSLLLVGDKGFDSDPLRCALEELGHEHAIPGRSNRKAKPPCEKKYYRTRYRVENLFCRLKRWAGFATRRDKLASHFLSLAHFAALIDRLQF
jgi:transposase